MPISVTLEPTASHTATAFARVGVSAHLTPLAPHSADALHLLDDPQEWSAFSRPSTHVPEGWESSVVIEGMHCAACAVTLEEAIAAVPGVQEVQVSAGCRRFKHAVTVPCQPTTFLPVNAVAWKPARHCGVGR